MTTGRINQVADLSGDPKWNRPPSPMNGQGVTMFHLTRGSLVFALSPRRHSSRSDIVVEERSAGTLRSVPHGVLATSRLRRR